MRLDLFLKVSRLVSKRSLANELCDRGQILINGVTGKPSRSVKAEDKIEIKRGPKVLIAVVLSIPRSKQVSKDVAHSLYEIVSETTDPEAI